MQARVGGVNGVAGEGWRVGTGKDLGDFGAWLCFRDEDGEVKVGEEKIWYNFYAAIETEKGKRARG